MTYVIKVKLDFITDIPCYGSVWNVKLPVPTYVDLVGCRCYACHQEAGYEGACKYEREGGHDGVEKWANGWSYS